MGLIRSRTWTVRCPPAKRRVVAGTFVPTPLLDLGVNHSTRRVTIEIYGPSRRNDDNDERDGDGGTSVVSDDDDEHDDDDSDEDGDSDLAESEVGDRRRRAGLSRSAGTARNLVDLCQDLHDEDIIVFRILKPRRRQSPWSGLVGFLDRSDSSSSSEDEEEDDEEEEEKEKEEEETRSTHASGTNNATRWIQGALHSLPVSHGGNSRNDPSPPPSRQWIQEALRDVPTDPYAGVLQEQRRRPSHSWRDWMEHRKCGLDGIVDDRIRGDRTWEATVGLGSHRERREFVFGSPPQLRDFVHQLEGLRSLVNQRAQQRLWAYRRLREESRRRLVESFDDTQRKQQKQEQQQQQQQRQQQQQPRRMMMLLSTNSNKHMSMVSPLLPVSIGRHRPSGEVLREALQWMDDNSQVNLLVEIVSASDVPITDRNSTDPYVSVYLGTTKIHRTKAISKEYVPCCGNGGVVVDDTMVWRWGV
jgi:hypothetical protein